jgi:hypothetical protein
MSMKRAEFAVECHCRGIPSAGQEPAEDENRFPIDEWENEE